MPRGSNNSYLIKKRYSQFYDLHQSLKRDLKAVAPQGLQYDFIDTRFKAFKPSDESRKDMLNSWLMGILLESKFMLNASIFDKMTDFFNYFDNVNTNEVIRGVSLPTVFR